MMVVSVHAPRLPVVTWAFLSTVRDELAYKTRCIWRGRRDLGGTGVRNWMIPVENGRTGGARRPITRVSLPPSLARWQNSVLPSTTRRHLTLAQFFIRSSLSRILGSLSRTATATQTPPAFAVIPRFQQTATHRTSKLPISAFLFVIPPHPSPKSVRRGPGY